MSKKRDYFILLLILYDQIILFRKILIYIKDNKIFLKKENF